MKAHYINTDSSRCADILFHEAPLLFLLGLFCTDCIGHDSRAVYNWETNSI